MSTASETEQPDDEALYRERGKRVARDGYVTVSEEYLRHMPPTKERAYAPYRFARQVFPASAPA